MLPSIAEPEKENVVDHILVQKLSRGSDNYSFHPHLINQQVMRLDFASKGQGSVTQFLPFLEGESEIFCE